MEKIQASMCFDVLVRKRENMLVSLMLPEYLQMCTHMHTLTLLICSTPRYRVTWAG